MFPQTLLVFTEADLGQSWLFEWHKTYGYDLTLVISAHFSEGFYHILVTATTKICRQLCTNQEYAVLYLTDTKYSLSCTLNYLSHCLLFNRWLAISQFSKTGLDRYSVWPQ